MKNVTVKNKYLLKLNLIFVCHFGWFLHHHGMIRRI